MRSVATPDTGSCGAVREPITRTLGQTPMSHPSDLSTTVPSDDYSPPGSLRVEDQPFALVPEWVIDTDISDAAFRVYSLLLRYGNTSGQRMPSRKLLAVRLHRSVDAVDRAVRELADTGLVRIEHPPGRTAQPDQPLPPHHHRPAGLSQRGWPRICPHPVGDAAGRPGCPGG
jgi:hypothetical protein